MILYEIGTTDFSKNGLGYLPNVLNAKVVDAINGEYSLTFEYPINDDMAEEIYEDRIVKCKVSDGTQQCFVIKTIQKNFDKMSVYCMHLFYMLNDNFVEDTYPQNLSPKPFLDHVLANANYQLPFATNSDIVSTATARYVRKNIVETILGDISNSMYNLFGMELKRDNWNIGLKARIGTDKGEKLIFGKNITGVDVSVDTTGIYTRIMPIGFDGLLLPEKYVDASNINDYPYPRICLYEFPEIRYSDNLEDTEAYHTLADAYQALRDAVAKLYNEGINLPLINISINWLELSKTEEYKQYSALERVDLGDTLTCNLFGMDYETRVIKTTYNPLTDRIEKFEIGTSRPSITNTITRNEIEIQNLPSSILEEATANATDLITQAMGGYVYKTNNELYIMDNPDPNQAVKVWRWNLNGLGYSSTGINGTYGLAMTMDGSIVADFITTGQLSANVINASTLIGVINGNTSQLKLQADQLDLNGAVTANNNFKINQDGSVEMNNGNIDLYDDGEDTQTSRISITETGTNNNNYSAMYSYGIDISAKNSLNQYVRGHLHTTGAGSSLYDSNFNNIANTSFTTGNGFIESHDDTSTGNTLYSARYSDGGNGIYNEAILLATNINGSYKRNFVVTNKDSGNTMLFNGDATINGRLSANGGLDSYNGIELYHYTPFIDFHYDYSSSDYTSRIIESASGFLETNATFKAQGELVTGGGIRNIQVKQGTGAGTNDWHCIGGIDFDWHSQGTFAYMKIILGRGNNGTGDQNAWIDLYMQLGWTGSVDGRFGCYAEYHAGHTDLNWDNTKIRVMANDSNTSYAIFLQTTWAYSVPNVITYTPQFAHYVGHDFWTSSPGGIDCDVHCNKVGGSFSCNKTGGNGNVTSAYYWDDGSAVQIEITFNTSGGSTGVGSNVWEGNVSGVPLPKSLMSGCGFYSSTGYIGSLEPNGNFKIRVIGATSAQNSGSHVIAMTYLKQ